MPDLAIATTRGDRQYARDLYPTFQFATGRPKPGVRAILAALPENMTFWQIAFWWILVGHRKRPDRRRDPSRDA